VSKASQRNRASWNGAADGYQARHRDQLAVPECWGVWGVPESELGALGEVAGLDVLELGCGGAQWAIFLARRGARLVGLDGSEGQLRHARRHVAEAGAKIPLVHANGERVPFAEASFDLVFCDHGVMSWADPHETVPEAARVLRPGGRFVFNMSSPLHDLCWAEPEDVVADQLCRPYFGMHALEDEGGVCFQLPYGEWIRLFRRNGLVVEGLIELRPPLDAETTYGDYVSLEWARRFPAENLWSLRKE
jgi:SAM-dependent methyltransferase